MAATRFPTGAYRDYLDRLASLSDDERVAFVVKLGRDVDDAEQQRVKARGAEMNGCQARVWIMSEHDEAGRLTFAGVSEAAIVQGLVRIMADSFSGLTQSELRAVGLDAVRAFPLGAMTTHRQVGMMAMLKHMQRMEPTDK